MEGLGTHIQEWPVLLADKLLSAKGISLFERKTGGFVETTRMMERGLDMSTVNHINPRQPQT